MSSFTGRHSTGFTLVEVLVVIAVIGILASIGAVFYQGAQRRAVEATLQTDLRSASSALEAVRNTANGYPAGTTLPPGITPTQGNTLTYSGTTTDYCLTASSARHGAQSFYMRNGEDVKPGTC